MYPRFEGMMSNLPTKAHDEALLIEKQRKLRQAEEQRRSFEALRDDFRNYLSKYNPQALNPHPRPRESSPSVPIIQTTPIQPTKPPEPPDSKQSEEPNPNSPTTLTTLPHSPQPPDPPNFKRSRQKSSTKQVSRLKYSCDEIYERMENGLCIFCEEHDTPGHQELKHKGFRIIVKDYDGDKESLESAFESSGAALPNGEKTPRGEDGVATNTFQDNDSSPEKGSTNQVLHQIEVSPYAQILKDINTHHIAHQLFDKMRIRVQKKTSDEAVTFLGENKKMFGLAVQANHVWKPGGLCLQILEMNEDEQPLDYVETLITNAEKQPLDYLVLETVVIDEDELRAFEEKSLYTKELVETVSSIQEIKLNGVKNVRALDMVQNKEASQEKELRPDQVPIQIDSFSYLQVPFSELKQRRNNRLQLHTVMVLNEFQVGNGFDVLLIFKELVHVKEMNSHFCDANHIWEPGRLHTQWDWLRRANSTVLNISQRFQRADLKEILSTVLKFQKEILDDVLSLLKTQELFIAAERELLNWIVNEERRTQLCSGLDIVERILLGTYSCEYKKLLRLPVYQLLEVQEILSPGYKRETLKYMSLEISQTVSHVWHRWKNKAEKWQEVSDLMVLSLVSFQSNTKESLREFICGAIIAGKAKYSGDNVAGTAAQSSELLIQNMEILRRWMYFETAIMPLNISDSRFMQSEGLGSLKMLSASYALIKGAVSSAGILHLANVHELFHSPRPPELFLCEVCRWLSHMTELLVQVSNIYSSLRTRMFSTGEYCDRKLCLVTTDLKRGDLKD